MAKKLSKGKRRVPKTVLRLPDLDQAEVGGVEQSQLDRCSTRVPTCHRGIHRLVLLGAAAIVQQDRGSAVSHTPGI